MATIEHRSNQTVIFINMKDLPAGEQGQSDFHALISNYGGAFAMKTELNKSLMDYLGLKSESEHVIILLEELTNQLDPFELDAIIDHEIAHCVMRHLDIENPQPGAFVDNVKEMEADAYSAARNGASVMKSALLNFIKIIAKIAAKNDPIRAASAFAFFSKEASIVERLEALDAIGT